MADDLVARLHAWADVQERQHRATTMELLVEAADELERYHQAAGEVPAMLDRVDAAFPYRPLDEVDALYVLYHWAARLAGDPRADEHRHVVAPVPPVDAPREPAGDGD